MMELSRVRSVLTVPDPAEASQWLVENLFFEPTDEPDVIKNGSCEILLHRGTPKVQPPVGAGQYRTGAEHIALRTGDIDAAQAHCMSRGIALNLCDGHAWHNPGVYTEGEYYFNFEAPFGQLIEISQRVSQPDYGQTRLIEGLDHIGVPSVNLEDQLKHLAEQGFTAEFPTVYNYNDREGNIQCCMVRRGETVLEVYQFMDMTGVEAPASRTLTLSGVEI